MTPCYHLITYDYVTFFQRIYVIYFSSLNRLKFLKFIALSFNIYVLTLPKPCHLFLELVGVKEECLRQQHDQYCTRVKPKRGGAVGKDRLILYKSGRRVRRHGCPFFFALFPRLSGKEKLNWRLSRWLSGSMKNYELNEHTLGNFTRVPDNGASKRNVTSLQNAL